MEDTGGEEEGTAPHPNVQESKWLDRRARHPA